MKSLRARREAGDTLVEVLIAIAVVSSVLGITYSIMSRNLSTMRDNQERTEATKIAQAQLEALKNAYNNNDPALTAQGSSPFCLDPSGTIVDLPGDATPNDDLAADNPDDYPDTCERQGIYRTGIDFREWDGEYYKVYVRWDRIGGGQDNGRAEVVMAYVL